MGECEHINAVDSQGCTALWWASLYVDTAPMIPMLLDAKADVNLANAKGQTPLHMAAENPFPERESVGPGRQSVLRLLIKGKANIKAVDEDDHTPLYWAVSKCNRRRGSKDEKENIFDATEFLIGRLLVESYGEEIDRLTLNLIKSNSPDYNDPENEWRKSAVRRLIEKLLKNDLKNLA